MLDNKFLYLTYHGGRLDVPITKPDTYLYPTATFIRAQHDSVRDRVLSIESKTHLFIGYASGQQLNTSYDRPIYYNLLTGRVYLGFKIPKIFEQRQFRNVHNNQEKPIYYDISAYPWSRLPIWIIMT